MEGLEKGSLGINVQVVGENLERKYEADVKQGEVLAEIGGMKDRSRVDISGSINGKIFKLSSGGKSF
uniref:Uncharacterized protein n=1 Tax=Nelumbo nucifera TaxID=4432 RepID=A0A822XYF3_NELNU|nr:TPA_asm: hypothetical protein HUJ06_026801 [Nelumbo nucifera]